MKKFGLITAIVCIIILFFSFTGKSLNEGESNFIIMTRYGGDLIISYGNNQSEILELRAMPSNNSFISNDEIIIKQLNKFASQGYEIKTTIPSGNASLNLYSIILEKK